MQSIINWTSEFNADSWTALAIDAVLKSTVLLLLAAAFAAMLRRASAAVRHRTWCLTFAGLLLLPLLSYALPAWQIPVLPPVEEAEPPAVAEVVAPQPQLLLESIDEAEFQLDPMAGDLAFTGQSVWPIDIPTATLEIDDVAQSPAESATLNIEQTAISDVPVGTAAVEAPPRPLVWTLPALALWALGGLLVVAPLILGVLHSVLLGVRAARVTDASWTGLLHELRGRLQLRRRVTLLESQRPVIPMTWGVVRPVVLVPETAQQWPEQLRRFVLLHELAHVKRWDVPFQILGRLACAVYWFHPLAWYALHRLRIERELACDDCVVTTGERPSDYAEQLVLIARACRPAGLGSVGVAMARNNQLEGRIRALFDKARSHVPLSARAARVLTVAAALLVTTVAVVRPSNRAPEPAAAEEDASADLETASVESETSVAAAAAEAIADDVANEETIVRGSVLDPDDKPVAGAKLQLIPNPFSRDSEEDAAPNELATADAAGHFEFRYEPDDFYGSAGEMLLVTAQGLAPYWQPTDSLNGDDELVVRLAADDVPIHGQILDLEGNPVTGAEVHVQFIRSMDTGNLDPFLEAVKEDGGSNFRFDSLLYKPSHIPTATTDDQGRFEMSGIGRERVVDLELAGQGIHHARIRTMTRESEAMSPLDPEQAARGQALGRSPVYGATFSYLVQPSRPIHGIVVDADTHEPLNGIRIGTLEAGASATTDEEGRFELDGCVKADEYRLLAHPLDNQSYLHASERVPDEDGVAPLDVTIEMTRGVVVQGRVVDGDGQPVSASVSYWPTPANTSLRKGIGGGEANAVGAFSDSNTDRNGEFSVTVLAGPGFIGIRAANRDGYETAQVDAVTYFRDRDVPYFSGVNASSASKDHLYVAISDTGSTMMPQSNFHAIELLNVDPAAAEPERTIELHATPDDAANSADATPANESSSAKPLLALAQGNASQETAADDQASNETKIVRGTVLDPDGKPAAGATVQVVRLEQSRWRAAPASAIVLSETTTSTTGEYELQTPKPGPTAPGDTSQWTDVVVTAPDYGLACHAFDHTPDAISLAPPQAIRGRIVDLEGQPIQGVSIHVLDVFIAPSADRVNEWVKAVRETPLSEEDDLADASSPASDKTRFPIEKLCPSAASLFPELETDADGRFELDGIGSDRVAALLLKGPGLVQSVVQVLTRPLDQPLHAHAVARVGASNVFYGADFTFVAGTSAPVTGVLRDLDSHEPIVGAHVMVSSLAGTNMSHDGYIVATTDAEGRYELHGLPPGTGNRLMVVADDQPYLITDFIRLPELSGLAPAAHDIELPKAVWATGRLFDETTGKPVQGWLYYSPFHGNEFAARYPQYADQTIHLLGNDRDYHTDADGRFRIPVIPGRGVICAKADVKDYRTGYGAERIPELVPMLKNMNVNPRPTFDHVAPAFFHSLREIDPPADAEEVAVDLPVDPGLSVELVFTDASGAPVTNVRVSGVETSTSQQGTQAKSDRATVIGLTKGKPTTVRAEQLDGPLAARMDITPTGESGPQTIVLHPPVVVRGRLVDPQNVPLAETEIRASSRSANGGGDSLRPVATDDNGEFSVNLIVGATYTLAARPDKFAILAKDLTANPGEAVDLGDLVIDPTAKNGAAATPKRPPIVTKSEETVDTKPAADASESVPATITVRGTVLDPEDQPVAGATVRAQTPLWAMLKPLVPDGWEPPVTETKSAANGEFEISFATQPLGDLSHLNPQWAEIWKQTVVAASAPGFGPAWVEYEDIQQPDQPVTLQLVEDLPVQGRVVNLEGDPLAGETITIGGPSAAQDEDLSAWLAAITAGEPPWTAWKKTPKSIDPGLAGIPETVVSDEDGRFEIRGVGRERHFYVMLESENAAHKRVKVATRLMEPVQAVVSTPPFAAVEPVFGARFTFAATPARVVTGAVRDANTGAPLVGAKVESYSLADRPRHANIRVLKTVTDEDGRFRLVGMPKGDGNRVLVLPNDDQPYFMREFEIPNPSGLAPVDVTIDVHRGIWITGRVTDAETGEPVHARLHYLPYLTNTFAQDVPEFDDNGNVNGDQLRYQTKPDGTYRLVGLPGPAVIGVESVLKAYPMGQGYAELPGPKEGDGRYVATYRNPVNPMAKWPTAMTYIDPSAGVESVTVDFQLTAGGRVAMRIVDPDGQPLSGAEVTGRQSRSGISEANNDPDFEAVNFGTDEERTILFRHKDRGLGWVQRIKGSDAGSDPVVVKLQPVATVTGRLMTTLGDPITGMVLEAVPLPSGDFARHLPKITTNQDGRFTYEILPGAKYTLQGRGGGFVYVALARDLAVKPGQKIDLGDLRISDNGEVMQKPDAKPAAAKSPAREQTAVAKGKDEKQSRPANSQAQPARTYSGRVTDTDGQPLTGAKVWLSIYAGEAEHEQMLRAVATSDQDGQFRFSLDSDVRRFINAAPGYWWSAKLVAVAPHHGIDWLPLPVFEDDPANTSGRDEMSAHLTSKIGALRLKSRSLRLRSAGRPVHGQLVDLEGRPLPNVVVRVESVMQPDVRLLLQAFEEHSKDRYFEAVNAAIGGSINALHLVRLFPPVTTDADGRFELAGIGDDQLATLSINGASVEARLVHVLGRSIEPARIPHFDSYPGGAKDAFYGWDFSHAVGPSIPVEGVVKDFDTREPVANTQVRVERLFSEGGGADEGQLRVDTRHLRTMTDAQGRFRIDGIPPGIGHVLEAKPPKDEPFLMALHTVSLSPADAPVKSIDVQVKKAFWIEGRVTDQQTGEGVPVYVDYFALERNPHTLDKHGLRQGWEIHRFRSDNDGLYRVPGLPGPGVVMVRAIVDRGYPLEVGAESVDGYDKESRWIHTNPVSLPLANWHLIRQIDPAEDATSFTCDFELDAGQQIAGRVVGPDGSAVTNFSALGEVVKDGFWKRHADGRFAVQGYDGQGPRQLFFKSTDESLIGQLRVEGTAPDELVVKLQPAVRVTGRLIESETSLPAERYSLYCDSSSRGPFRIDRNCRADDEGRFEINGLLAGLTYQISTANAHFSSGKNDFSIDLTEAKPGDVIDLGDVPKENVPKAAAKAAVATGTENATTEPDTQLEITVRGKVLDPDGNPAVGASVYVGLPRFGYESGLQTRPPMRNPVEPDGSFKVSFSPNDLLEDPSAISADLQRQLSSNAFIAASANGFGPAWIRASERSGNDPVTLQLVADQPITGRLVSLEGAPLSGVQLRVTFVEAAPDENLQPWIDALKSGRPLWQASADHNHQMFALNVIDRADSFVTDNDGRFRIKGVGRDRIVRVMLAGPQAARQIFRMVSRDTEPLPTNLMPSSKDGDKVYGASTDAIVVAPSQPIVGTVRDAETGAPLAGVTIESYRFAGSSAVGSRDNLLRASTDPQGRFQLNGMPKGKGNVILAVPNDEQPYFMREIEITEQPGLDPIEVAVDLHRGLWIEGKVIDLATDEPVTASLHYLPFLENQIAGRLPEFTTQGNGFIDGATGYQHRYRTRPDGTFRIVGLPGRGIVGAETFGAPTGAPYRGGAGSERIAGIDEDGTFPTYVGPLAASNQWPNAMAEINPTAEDDSVAVVLKADPGKSIRIRVTDPNGAPVTDYRVSGQSTTWPEPLDIPEFQVEGLRADESRNVVILHAQKRLGKVIRIDAGDQPREVQLEPCCRVHGRLLDSTGAPLNDVELIAWTEPDEDFKPMLQERARTDDDGRFEFANVPPGCEYRITGQANNRSWYTDNIRFEARSGEDVDLGNVSFEGDK